jgi:hypothetical protein
MDDEELTIEEINTKVFNSIEIKGNLHYLNMHHLEIQSDLIHPT